jgi:Carboxypeptidase regulatory-like domain
MKNPNQLFKLKKAISMVMLLVTLLTITTNLSSCSNKDDGTTGSTGALRGTVKDELDNEVVGATVTLKQSGQKDKTTTTNTEGFFNITDVPTGTVSVTCSGSLLIDQTVTATITPKTDTGVSIIMLGNATIKTLLPDPKFEEALIQQGFDTAPIDGSVPTYKINRATNLAVGGITDLTGIQDFKALETLDCSNDANATVKLTNLDVSKNTALKTLNCSFNNITTLDLSKNVAMSKLGCYDNLLTTLDLSNNIGLTDLAVGKNLQLTNLNLSKNTALKKLSYTDNNLTTLDVSQNTALETLWCFNNKLTSLDVSKNTALQSLECYNNQLTTLNVSNNKALRFLDCYSNKLATLDVNNNSALIYLACSFNKLTTLDVSKNTALGGTNGAFFCSDNLLTTLNVKNGNNINIKDGKANFKNNVSGLVIAVDDVPYSKTNWSSYKDAGAIYVSSF